MQQGACVRPPGIRGWGPGTDHLGQADSRTWSSCVVLTLFRPQRDGDNCVNGLGEAAPCNYPRLRAAPTQSSRLSQGHSSPLFAGLALTSALARVQPWGGGVGGGEVRVLSPGLLAPSCRLLGLGAAWASPKSLSGLPGHRESGQR